MIKPFMKKEKTLLETEIDHVAIALQKLDPISDEYEIASKNLERLYKLKIDEESKKSKVEPKDIISMVTNLIDVGFILNHERLHVITSKAFNFIHKGHF